MSSAGPGGARIPPGQPIPGPVAPILYWKFRLFFHTLSAKSLSLPISTFHSFSIACLLFRFFVSLMIIPPTIHTNPFTKRYIGKKQICPMISGYGSISIRLKAAIKIMSIIYAPTDITNIKNQVKTHLVFDENISPIAPAIAYETIISVTIPMLSPYSINGNAERDNVSAISHIQNRSSVSFIALFIAGNTEYRNHRGHNSTNSSN